VKAVLKTTLTFEAAEQTARADVSLQAISTPMPMPVPRLRSDAPTPVR